ncbi:hypothetical protein Fmac_011108 [Flemingia macrophylla]|uniref:Uncharacterized protein n=1 Tax=Flemingia macrophylla TaxID=520843 RepID=A0ABD1MMB4_9FABA
MGVTFSGIRAAPNPNIPKPPPYRTLSSSVKFHQSTQVNILLMSPRRLLEFDDNDGRNAVEDEEMLWPHEIVARNLVQTTPRSSLSPPPPLLPRRGATRN